jgi:CO/xanthine dehydrogenase FAD-binding subunit
MLRPDIVEPGTIKAALQALSRPGAVPLAGATDLIPAIRKGEIKPRLLVNLKQLPGASGIARTRAGIRIGALTPVADLLESEIVANDCPLLAEVARDFGSPQIRSLATVGGNLCNAAPSADLALPLLALDARLQVRAARGPRALDLCDFFRGVNKTVLRRGEILTAILIPRPRVRTGAAHAKLGVRRAMDLAFAAVAAALRLRADGRTCDQARIALGAVAPIPMRARKAEALLEGQPVTPDLIRTAADAAAAEARPITDLRASADYRRDMTATLARRVLQQALRRAKQKERAR